MKHNIKYVISLVFMFLLTQGAWADPAVTIIKQLNGSPAATASPGEVTSEIANGKCTLTVTPADGNYVTKDFITVYSVVTGNVAQGPRRTPDLDNTPIAVSNKGENTDPTGVTTYEFTMPADGSDAEVTVNFHSITTYNLFIGETQVTVLNAADVLGDGKVSFTSVLNNQVITNTLTLNGAELTVPVKVGLDNLTIDIQGENSITTTEACIQKMDNTSPSLIFRSNSDEVGSLTLTNTDEENYDGVMSTGFNDKYTISRELALIMYRYGFYTSYTGYFTAGEVHNAQLVPSLGVQVGDIQVYEGNKTNVLYDEETPTVVYDAENHKLTLKGANISGAISTSLENLTIELVGNNSITQDASYATLQSMYGDPVTMTIQSTGATKGSLRMYQAYTEAGTFADAHVTLDITSPLTVLSGSLTGNNDNNNTVVIGVSYGLTVKGVDVTSANSSNVLSGYNDGQVSYDAGNNTLTLNGANLYDDGDNIVYSGSENLTIALNGSNRIDNIVYSGQGETKPQLTFKKVEGALPYTTLRAAGDFRDNFSTINYENWLGLYVDDSYVNDVFYDVMSKTPTISSNWNGTTNKREVTIESKFDGTVKYSLTYADENLAENNKTNETITKDDKIEMLGPATITATITIGSETSPEETAYYFGVMPNPLKFEYDGGDTKPAFAATLYPSVEGVSFTPYSSPGDFATFSEEGEVTINGFGSGLAYASLNLPEERTFSVITDSIGFRMEVLPVKPTITKSDKITLSVPETLAGDNTSIYYKWEGDDAYTQYTEPFDVEVGTLYAQTRVSVASTVYASEDATAEYLKDIAKATVVGLAESATYTGAAITPSFTVKESEDENAATILTDNYEVSYLKVDYSNMPQAPARSARRAPEEGTEPVDAMIDAGDYLIIITGKNEYGGTMDYIPFKITQAENSLTTTPAAVAELIYTGDALELVTAGVAKFGDVLYKLGADGTYSAKIPTATDANTTGYTVYYKVEGNDNYTGIEETSVVVTIDKATATITKAPAAKTLTYTGDALELVEAGTVSAGTMVYSTTIDGTFAEAIPTATNAGSYTVYYKVNGDDNYAGIEASETNKVTVTIGQAEITSVELAEATLPYSGEAQTPTIAKVMAGDIEVGAEYYEITGGNEKTAVGEYELTVAAKTMEGNNFKGSAKTVWSIVNRTLTVGEDVQFADGQKWASFYTPSEDLELPEGVMAYIVTGVNESEKSVTVKAVNKVLKSVPMLLENNSTETTTNVSAEGNLLQVATEATAVSSINGTVYGLYNNAMMRVTTGTIALGKCYLVVNGKQNAPRLTITKDDQATGIESLTPALSEGEGAWYTIDGKKLQQKPTKKGIYIVNGKKMVVNNK